MEISNAQRAHDLAVALLTKITKENDDTNGLADQYIGLYAVLLRDLDKNYPNGVPEQTKDFPAELNQIIQKASVN